MVKSTQFEIDVSEIPADTAPQYIEREKIVVLLDKAQRFWNKRYKLSQELVPLLSKNALRKLASKLLPRYTAKAYSDILYLTHGAAALTLKPLIPTLQSHQVFSYIEYEWLKSTPTAHGLQAHPPPAPGGHKKKKKKKQKSDFTITPLTGDFSFMNIWLTNEVKQINWNTLELGGELGIATAISLNLHGSQSKYQLSDYAAAAGINAHLFDFGKGILGLLAMRRHEKVETND
jgi:hypothetical protein